MNRFFLTVTSFLVSVTTVYPLSISAAELYARNGDRFSIDGSFKVRHYFSHDNSIAGDQSKVKLTLKGETRITNTLTGFAKWEYNVKASSPENAGNKKDTTRIAYAGMSFGQYGTGDYGRNYGILNDINGWTGAPVPVFGGLSYSDIDNFMTYRTNNVATYRNPSMSGLVDGLDFGFQVQGKNDGRNNPEGNDRSPGTYSRAVTHQNGHGAGASLIYRFNSGLSAGMAYARSSRTPEQRQDHLGNRADGWNTGLKYEGHNIYLATIYGEVNNMHYTGKKSGFAPKARGVEFLAQYEVDNGIKLSGAYLQGRVKKTEQGDRSEQNYVKFIDLAASYSFNKNIALTLEYKINLLNKNTFIQANGISTDDIMVTMLNYIF